MNIKQQQQKACSLSFRLSVCLRSVTASFSAREKKNKEKGKMKKGEEEAKYLK